MRKEELRLEVLREATAAAKWFFDHTPSSYKIKSVKVVNRIVVSGDRLLATNDFANSDGGKACTIKLSLDEINKDNFKSVAWTRVAHEWAHLSMQEHKEKLLRLVKDKEAVEDTIEAACDLFETLAAETIADPDTRAALDFIFIEKNTASQ